MPHTCERSPHRMARHVYVSSDQWRGQKSKLQGTRDVRVPWLARVWDTDSFYRSNSTEPIFTPCVCARIYVTLVSPIRSRFSRTASRRGVFFLRDVTRRLDNFHAEQQRGGRKGAGRERGGEGGGGGGGGGKEVRTQQSRINAPRRLPTR